MLPIPTRKSMLVTGPWTAGLAASVPAFIFLPALGREAAMALALALALPMTIGAGYLLYRSDFGALHGILASVLGWLFFVAVAAGVTSFAAQLSGAPVLVTWVVASSILALLAVQWLVTRHHLARLEALGESGDWVRATLDLNRFQIRGGHETADGIQRLNASRWLLAIALFNIPWMIKAWRLDVGWVTPLLAACMVVVAALFCVRTVGPLAGHSWYVLRLERRLGVHFVHEELEGLSRLRRSFWLSRMLMPRAPRRDA